MSKGGIVAFPRPMAALDTLNGEAVTIIAVDESVCYLVVDQQGASYLQDRKHVQIVDASILPAAAMGRVTEGMGG